MNENSHYMDMEELSRYLKIPKGTLYKFTMDNTIPCFKLGKQLRFSKETIDVWVRSHRKKNTKRRKTKVK